MIICRNYGKNADNRVYIIYRERGKGYDKAETIAKRR